MKVQSIKCVRWYRIDNDIPVVEFVVCLTDQTEHIWPVGGRTLKQFADVINEAVDDMS